MLELSADHARRFLVRRHLLDPPRALPGRPESVLEVVRRIGSLQFDPLHSPGARSHDLVLHARVAGYKREWCDQWLYAEPARRRLFEAYNKSLNILPIDELPFYRSTWDRAQTRYEGGILAARASAVSTILERLRVEGPLSTAAFKGMGPAVDWHWAPTAAGRAALEALFETGQVGIARRDGSRRTYDLCERLFPADLLARRVSREASMRHRLLSRYRGVGLMGASAASELVGGTGTAADRAAMLAELVADGTLLPAAVEGVRGPRYVLAEELPLVEATARAASRRARRATLLAPLDPLLWDRRLLRSLFGFDYLWEVYVPEQKRRHGYYVVPILYGDRMVGRIEPRIDRKRGVLEILGVWFEPGVDGDDRALISALAEALDALAAFGGADRLAFGRKHAVRALARAFERS